MKQVLLFSAALWLVACGQGPVAEDTSASETVSQSEATPQGEAAQAQVPTVLPLPPMPDLPAPVALTENSEGELYFPARSPYDMTRVYNGYEDLPIHSGLGTLYLPDGASADSPVPAMVIMHGSGGIRPEREHAYAELFNTIGVAGFVVDYYSPRGVTDDTPYVMKTMTATEVDVISDAFSALSFLADHPAIDPARIGVTGYSYGGMGTRYATDARLADIMAPGVTPFALHMDIYGPCHQITGNERRTGAPYLAIYGDQDNSVEPERCEEVQASLEAQGVPVTAYVIPGAGHAWENDQPLETFPGGFIRGCEFSWDTETGAFLVDGVAGPMPTPDMTRPERAGVRAGLAGLAGKCVGQGYLIGRNAEADAQSKEWQLTFLQEQFGL